MKKLYTKQLADSLNQVKILTNHCEFIDIPSRDYATLHLHQCVTTPLIGKKADGTYILGINHIVNATLAGSTAEDHINKIIHKFSELHVERFHCLGLFGGIAIMAIGRKNKDITQQILQSRNITPLISPDLTTGQEMIVEIRQPQGTDMLTVVITTPENKRSQIYPFNLNQLFPQ